ncbi:MAG: hypothetical protein ACXV7J_03900 [Methylomonas sp.]
MKFKIVTPSKQANSLITADIVASNIKLDSPIRGKKKLKLHYFGPSVTLSTGACFHAFCPFSPVAGLAVNDWRRVIDCKSVRFLSDGLINRFINILLN